MGSIFTFLYNLLLLIVFLGMAFLFGVNAYGGVMKGKVWARSTAIERSNGAVLFWIATVISGVLALMCVGMAWVMIWGLVDGW